MRYPHKSAEREAQTEESSSLDSLFAEEADLNSDDVQPLSHESLRNQRPPRPPSKNGSVLSRSSAPTTGFSPSMLHEEHRHDGSNEQHGQNVSLEGAVAARRQEENLASRLSKSLSTAYLIPGPGLQIQEGTASNSDGGVPLGNAELHVPTVVAPAAGLHVPNGASTPLAAVVLPAPGANTTATNLLMVAPGSQGAHGAMPPGAGGGGGSGGGLCSASTGTTPLPPFSHTRHAHSHSLGAGEEPLQGLAAYVVAEAQPAEKLPTADVVWGQTERERVYNFLLHVPYQLERLICFGSLLLMDSFLGVFTLLPLRSVIAVLQLLRGAVAALCPSRRSQAIPSATPGGASPTSIMAVAGAGTATAAGDSSSLPGRSSGGAVPFLDQLESSAPSFAGQGGFASAAAAAAVAAAATTKGSSFSGPGAMAAAAAALAATSPVRRPRAPPRLSGSQLYDMLCLAILCVATAVLRTVRPGVIYYWLKDITSEFLKMSVLSTAFDISDKILSNFGNDVLEALSGTCTQWLAGKKPVSHVAADTVVAATIVTLHALTLMCQALIVAVALNSSRNGLLALLIANNFVEIKSTVFKKWDSTRIWALVCADAVERFHLLVVLSFVVVEEMDSAASWSPPPDYLQVCGLMVAAEVVIDIVKHAVLGKFNDVRPGIYREFHQDLCAKALAAQSHSAPRLLNFHHLAPAALAMRILLTLFWLKVDTKEQVWPRLLIVAVLYGVLCGFKLLFGYCIKVLAHLHTRYYSRKYGNKPRTGSGSRMTVHAGPGPGHALAAAPAALASAPLGHGTAAAPLVHHVVLAAPASPAPAGPAAAAAAAVGAAAAAAAGVGGVAVGVSSQLQLHASGNSISQPLAEAPLSVSAGGDGEASTGVMSPQPLLGAAPRRLSLPASGLEAVGSGFAAALLTSLTGIGGGSGHAKED